MTREDKVSILEALSLIAPANASGEDEDSRLLPNFLPLRSYSKLADNRVFLITGGRGAGKTELFRVLTSPDGYANIISDSDRLRHSNWIAPQFVVGYIGSKAFPAKAVFDKYANRNDEEITCLWGGLLCASLLKTFSQDIELTNIAVSYLGESTLQTLSRSSNSPANWLDWMCANVEKWESFLDHCDDYFGAASRQIFLTYDELDRICSQYSSLFLFIRTLLSFWFTHNSRWENIKAKIFLRSDLYNAKSLHFVDSSKMRAYHMELKWDSLSLYRLLVKRLANSGTPQAIQYLKTVPELLQRDLHGSLGYLPGDSGAAFKTFVDKIIGRYMGKDPKKGLSYTWVPNHIQDANGELSPRPFLKCFVFAASDICGQYDEIASLEEDHLLSPSRLQGALAEVSQDRVNELVQEEYGWLGVLKRELNGKSMLMDRSEFLKYLNPSNWKEERETLPGNSPDELLEALITLGIILETNDGRINVPEIYLHGFGLKRRGGIKRPR